MVGMNKKRKVKKNGKKKITFQKWYRKQNKYIKFFICIFFVLLTLFLFKLTYISTGVSKPVGVESAIKTETIVDKNKKYLVDVEFPTFKNIEVKRVVTNYIYDYIREFKSKAERNNKTNNTLNIDYDITFFDDYLLINFIIKDSLNPLRINKSIIIDSKESTKINNSEFFKNSNTLKNVIDNKACKKYSSSLCKELKRVNINDLDFKIKDDVLYVTYNNFNTGILISYIPTIKLSLNELKSVYPYSVLRVFNEKKEEEKEEAKKTMAFSFDDGPNENTNIILDALIENDSKATFFEVGTNMKNHKEIVNRVKANNMEIGGHTYSHRQLTTLTKKRIRYELNTNNIIYNKITDENLVLFRPPYGSVNNYVIKISPYAFINWNVDTLDWQNRNSKKIYKHILKTAEDGNIVLMHDIYSSTAEAVRMVLPELKARGYDIVTVSELAKRKNIEIKKGNVYYSFN